MDLNLSVDEEARVTMIDYLKNIVPDSHETIQGRVETPSADHLFTARDSADRKLLDEEQATAFHHAVDQIIFTTPQVRKDIHIAVVLLYTRVISPYEDEWRKPRQVLQYIISTICMLLIMSMDKLNIVKWWVDASCAIKYDCRIHIGVIMSLGWGSGAGMSIDKISIQGAQRRQN